MIRKVYDQYNELYPIKNVNTMFVYVCLLAPWSLSYSIWIFTNLKLCLVTAIHNFKWLKMYSIWFVKFKSQHIPVFQDWKRILF